MFQSTMLNKIDSFFHSIQQVSMLNSSRSIKPITLKMFVDVSNLLLKLLDVKQTLTMNNYVEELPKIVSKLHYPGVVAKSWLKTANAMHSWPNVLGWICWLTEICEIRDIAEETFKLDDLCFIGDNQKESEMKKLLCFSMFESYAAWNEEKPDEENAMIEHLLQIVEDHQSISQNNMASAQSDLENATRNLQATDNKLKDTIKQSNDLQSELNVLENERLKLLEDTEAKKTFIETTTANIQKTKVKCVALSEEVGTLQTQYEELVSVVEQQPMSCIERDEIRRKCTEIRNSIFEFDKNIADMEKELFSLDLKLASIHQNRNKEALKYNTDVFMYFKDSDIHLDDFLLPEKPMMDLTTKELLNEKMKLMNDFKENQAKQLMDVNATRDAKLNENEDLQERVKLLLEENQDMDSKLLEQKTAVSTMKGKAKNEESKLRDLIKSEEEKIKKLQGSMPDVQALSIELQEATDKLDAVKRRKTHLEKNAKLFFEKLYTIIGGHRSEVARILSLRNKTVKQ